MAEEKKSHARESAGVGVNNVSATQISRPLKQSNRIVANQTPEVEMSNPSLDHDFGTPSSQGQGESYRDSINAQTAFPGMSLGADGVLLVSPEEMTDEDFDYRGTARKEYENEIYKRLCSEIIDGFLFLSGDLVARDAEKIAANGITHVINCAADYSDDYHKDKGVVYKSYHLKDHIREDIACIFYDAIQFMMDCRASGGRCLVHCVQGISRSATICCAYLILTEGLTYNQAYERVKGRRACANPNMTFI